jgi:hypothetical protein
MTISDVLHWIGVGALLTYAIASIALPRFVAHTLEHVLTSGRGISEFRILHGGFFLGLALFALYINNPLVYQALGWAWIGAAMIRIFAYLPDRPTRNISLISFLAEMMLGIFLLV